MIVKKISNQLLTIFKALHKAEKWLTVQEIVVETNLRKGSINRLLKSLKEEGVVEVLVEMNYYLYRVNETPSNLKDKLINLLDVIR